MTIKDIFSGNHGVSSNKPLDRYHNGPTGGSYSYPGPVYPPYPPSPPYHGPPSYSPPPPPPIYHGPPSPPAVFKHYSFSHSSGKSGGGGNAALSALTLLSFLFFLNILQQCLKDQMMSMNPQVMVMATGREELPRTQSPAVKEAEKVYTLIDGNSREMPKKVEEKSINKKVKIIKVNNRGDPFKTETIFVNAMMDAVSEVDGNSK